MSKYKNMNKFRRFAFYAIAGFSTFLVDLSFLWLLIEYFNIHYLYASAIAFLLGSSINYVISRRFVFLGTSRGAVAGYLFFLKFAIIGMLATVFFMWVLVGATQFNYVFVRILVAGFVGIINYLANLYLNFKVVGNSMNRDDVIS